jgi:hypothetical protein
LATGQWGHDTVAWRVSVLPIRVRVGVFRVEQRSDTMAKKTKKKKSKKK